MMLAGALYDVAFTLVRRLLRGENITQAHRGHLFQIAHRSGMAPWMITLIYWGFTLFGACSAWFFLAVPTYYKPMVVPVPLDSTDDLDVLRRLSGKGGRCRPLVTVICLPRGSN